MGNQVKKQTSKPSANYFRVDARIVNIAPDALSEKALKVYLLHCRRITQSKNMGCSLSGAKDASENTGVRKEIYAAAMQELIDKHLVKSRPDVKAGFLKVVPTEVLHFPWYDSKNKTFTVDQAAENQHRKYHNGGFLQIPNDIIDKGYLRQIGGTDSLLALMWLYSKSSLKEFCGVDFSLVHCNCAENPKGYIVDKENDFYSAADDVRTYHVSESVEIERLWLHINEFAALGLVDYVHALVYQDPLDIDNSHVKKILEQNEYGKYTLCTPTNKNDKVIQIIKLRYDMQEVFVGEAEEKKREEERYKPAGRVPERSSNPSIDEVKAYCSERRNRIDAEQFIDYYTANGWKQATGLPIVGWKAAIRTWEGQETGSSSEFDNVI